MSAEATRTLPGYDLWLDDFKPGDTFETEALTVTESMIIDFSLQWDPQSSHMNVHAKRTEMLGGLMASGFALFQGSADCAAICISVRRESPLGGKAVEAGSGCR